MQSEVVTEHRINLYRKARETTQSPGVYLMKDEFDAVLYVGKAKNLRNRVSSYFQSTTHEIFRTEMLVQRVRHFDIILTQTESEALILENTLIKKYKPKFNVRLKDDKAYPYLKLLLNQDYPRLEYTRRLIKDGARYFGPFPSSRAARAVADLLQEEFKLRDCSDNTFRHRSRPCLLYQMHRCSGPCVQMISASDYQRDLKDVVSILEGKADRILNPLREKMIEAAETEDFELAALYRDQIQSIELVTQTQGVLDEGSDRTFDAVAIARKENHAQFSLIQIRKGHLTSVRHFHLQNMDASLSDDEVFESAIEQFYLLEPDQKDEITLEGLRKVLLQNSLENTAILSEALRVEFLHPQSPYEKQLLQVAQTNANHALENALKNKVNHGIEALEDVQKKLNLAELPQRIECFDISNFQGTDSVASRVVFVDGEPDKNLYRRYKIKTVEGQNDFAMMKEVLGRRFSNDESLPDLVVVDGGKGQLAQAVAILEELAVPNVIVVGLAKARTESDFQSKEVSSSSERVFIPNRKNPVMLLPHTAAFRLLTHLRDEAHRFAISYHRQVRAKRHQ